jgi:hypothetical protein
VASKPGKHPHFMMTSDVNLPMSFPETFSGKFVTRRPLACRNAVTRRQQIGLLRCDEEGCGVLPDFGVRKRPERTGESSAGSKERPRFSDRGFFQ